MKRLNIKLLVWLIVTPAVLAIGIHFLHAYQIDRNAGSLRFQAEEAVKAGKTEDAIRFYSQYLKHRDDAEAYGELARLAADVADKPEANRAQIFRAYQIMEEATRRHAELTDTRKRLIDYSMKYGRFRDAIDHIDRLRSDGQAKTSDFDVKYAQCLLASGREDKAVKLLSEILGFDTAAHEFKAEPGKAAKETDAYILLAEVLRRQSEDSPEAKLVIDQLVAANPDSAKAHAERGRFLQRQKKFKEADADLTKSLELAPKDANAIITAAEIAGSLEDFDRANKLLQDGLKEHPTDERMYRALASLALQQKKPDLAMKYVTEGLKQAPSNQYLLLFRADLELQQGSIEDVQTTVKEMREHEFLPELIEFIECRILVSQKKWLNATRELERLRPLMARFPDLTMQIDLLLGQCYLSQAQPDRAMDAFRRALDSDSGSIAAQLGYADALRSMGKSEKAAAILQKMQERLGNANNSLSPALNNTVLQVTLTNELRKPEADRDWSKVDVILAQVLAGDSLSDPQKAVLQAEVLMLRKDFRQARGVLSAAVKKHPKDLAVWLGLLNLVSQDKESTKFTPDEILDRAEKAVGPVIQFKQVRLANAVRKQGKEAKEAVKKLEGELDSLTEPERLAFLADLGNAYYRLRDYENARRSWLEVAKSRPDDSKIQLTLFELAQEFGSEPDMDATLEEIRKTYGASSELYKFCEAERTTWLVKQKKKDASALGDARKRLDEARKTRPDWHEIARLSGEIYELEGKADEAITDFQRALELGPPNPSIARRLVALLYLRGRMNEVDKVMSFVGDVSSADPIRKIQIERDIRQGNLDVALEDAQKVVDAEPENSNNRLWYGQLLSRAGRDEEAQKAFRAAVEKDPKLVQGWLLLVGHLVGTKQLIDAQAVIREAKDEIAEDLQDAFLAQAYEMVRDEKEAEKSFLALLAKKPKDLGMMRNVASFYLRNNKFDKGRKQLDAMLAQPAASDPKASDADRANIVWARRATAQIIAQQGDYRSMQDALKMLEANKVDGKLLPEDMLIAASMLAKRSEHASRAQALKWLEQVQASRTLSPEEQFLMAQLYEQVGDWSKARETIINLLTKIENNAMLASTFSQLLLKHDELAEAERWIGKVEVAQPTSAAAVELRARLLAKQGKPDQAAELLQKLIGTAPNDNARMQMMAGVVTLLEEFDQLSAAETILRDAVVSFPRAKIALGTYLGRHGDLDEAFALFEDARKSYPLPMVIQTSLETLRRRMTEARKPHFAKVDGWLKSALSDEPDSLSLRMQQAELFDIQGRTSEVVSAYRQMLADKKLDLKQRAIINNNLAFVLATTGGATEVSEAVRLINESIEVLGPSSDLLDTRAVCLLAQGDTKRAVDDLRTAIIDAPSAIKYLHLAMAEAASGDKAAATGSLDKSRKLKLDVNALSAKERENYQKLIGRLEAK